MRTTGRSGTYCGQPESCLSAFSIPRSYRTVRLILVSVRMPRPRPLLPLVVELIVEV